ncbi:hypothetical protein [Bacteroides sp.]|uniref:hypothetical protein n=1 Tax=Bacteroides sp. TaxID=29523 RepID=UPI00260E6A82|nr:hypothetical protein [Bacteroides sp.]
MKELINMGKGSHKWRLPIIIAILALVVVGSIWLNSAPFRSGFEITDELGGNIFPSSILSVATTDAQVIVPVDSMYVGNPKSCIAVRIRSGKAYSKVRVEVAETPFFSRSVSEFVLAKPRTEYTIYPDVIWNYEALKQINQAEPISVAITVEMNGKDLGQRVRTFSVRSINECLLGYVSNGTKFHDTGIFFAAYVNEENPMIDQLLREALNTRIVNRFLGYQAGSADAVDKQVYALWNVLQKRNFRYSSVSNTSLSSNVVFSQRVRTFDDALESSQINCVDGSVLFASLLRAINIEPILVRTPGHMFVGYYTDSNHKDMNFLETTMIGDVDLDDFFPDEQLDSTMVGKSQNQMSRITFDKSKEYANKKYKQNEAGIHSGKLNYMFLEISKDVRRRIQPIGR